MKKFFKRIITLMMIMFIFIAVLYPVAVYSSFPIVEKWRTIYIETAMTTYTHKWLATAIIPRFVIDDVMYKNRLEQQKQQKIASNWDLAKIDLIEDGENIIIDDYDVDSEFEFYDKYFELDNDSFRTFLDENPEFLEDGYENIFIDNFSYKYDVVSNENERVYLLDAKNNLIIFEIKGEGYVGKLAVVKDPSQVSLAKSKTLGNYGSILRDFYKQNDALLTINCSGFGDQDATGNGGTVVGSLIIDGVEYGKPNSSYLIFGQKEDDMFYIEQYKNSNTEDYKWAAQFSPALVIDGEKMVKGSYGYGLQPRSAVGQSKNGDMLLLIIDGRQVGYSIGATVSDLADVMLKHDAYQAVNLDGGSSSLMWYDGKNITKPSSTNNLGRYLPDAIIVSKAEN